MGQFEALKRSNVPQKLFLTKSLKELSTTLTYDELQVQMKQFSKADKSSKGTVTLEEFRSALSLPDSPIVTELFHLLDVSDTGDIDFREYIAGRALMSKELTTTESIDIVFQSFDEKQDGIVDKDEFYNVMRFAFPELTTEESDKIFNSIDRKNPETVTYDEFTAHIKKHPEYYSLFLAYKKQSAAAKESDESKKKKKKRRGKKKGKKKKKKKKKKK